MKHNKHLSKVMQDVCAGVLVVDAMQLPDRARLALAHALQQGSAATSQGLTAPVSAIVWAVQPEMSMSGSNARKPSIATQTAMAKLTAAVDVVLPWKSLLYSPEDVLLDARPASPVSWAATQGRPAGSLASTHAATAALSAVSSQPGSTTQTVRGTETAASGQPGSIQERAAAEQSLQGAVAMAALQLEPVWDPTAAALAQVYFTTRRRLQVAAAEGNAGVGTLEALMRLAAACARLHRRRWASYFESYDFLAMALTHWNPSTAGRCSPCQTWRLLPCSWTGQRCPR